MDKKTKKTRPKPLTIQTIAESAPWVLVSHAAKESGLTELQIRKSGVELRKFGNADYIRPTELNAWILNGGKEENQP